MTAPPPTPQHDHREAYRLMLYRCKAGHLVLIWNSRDGVTPFGVLCREMGCHEDSTHVHWELDSYQPMRQLKPGDWYWRDGTAEEARTIARRRLELAKGTQWERPESEWDSVIAEIVKPEPPGEFAPGWPQLDRYEPTPPEPDVFPPPDAPGTKTIWACSGYGARTRQPFVDIHLQDVKAQLDPDDARGFALQVIECAEAAEQDAFLIEWVQKIVKADLAGAMGLLREYRNFRRDRIDALDAARIKQQKENADGL